MKKPKPENSLVRFDKLRRDLKKVKDEKPHPKAMKITLCRCEYTDPKRTVAWVRWDGCNLYTEHPDDSQGWWIPRSEVKKK